MDKIISCDYVMNEELIREYVNATVKTHSAPNIALIAVCTISSAVFAAQHNLSAAGLWIMAAAFLTLGEIFSSRRMIVRRTCNRLIRQHGTVNVRMRFSFENKIVCHMGRLKCHLKIDIELAFHYIAAAIRNCFTIAVSRIRLVILCNSLTMCSYSGDLFCFNRADCGIFIFSAAFIKLRVG